MIAALVSHYSNMMNALWAAFTSAVTFFTILCWMSHVRALKSTWRSSVHMLRWMLDNHMILPNLSCTETDFENVVLSCYRAMNNPTDCLNERSSWHQTLKPEQQHNFWGTNNSNVLWQEKTPLYYLSLADVSITNLHMSTSYVMGWFWVKTSAIMYTWFLP